MLQVSYFLSPEYTSGSPVTPVKWLIESQQAADVGSNFCSYLRNKTYKMVGNNSEQYISEQRNFVTRSVSQ